MKCTLKRVCAVLAVALLIVSTLPALAVSVDWGPTTVHLISKSGEPYFTDDIIIQDLGGAKITKIKSNKKSVLDIASFTTSTRSFINYTDEDDREEEDNAAIGLIAYKKGSATVSFKIGSKTYSKKYTVLAYVNPVKTFVETGIGSANLKSKFAKNAVVNEKLKAKAKAGTLTLVAASDWKIKRAEWLDLKNDDHLSQYFSKGASSVNMSIPAMKKGGQYLFRMRFLNTQTKAEVNICYFLS